MWGNGVPEGVVYSYPCTCAKGDYSIVQGLACDDFVGEKILASDKELREERAAVEELLG